ncbi:MAG: hypothetical protein Q4C70_06705 [Planctomycetia bacterium]|nr:hypothetical protein [Planctomycetia bacterium]
MTSDPYRDDTFMKFFSVADKIRQLILQTSTSKKNIALMESLTYRQQKVMVAVVLLTENTPVGVSLKKLAERMNMTVPATSVLVESMVQNKIFHRITSQTDRRAVCIKLSDLGMSIMNAFRAKMDEHIQELYTGITPEEKEVFSKVVNQFHEKLFPEEQQKD